MLVNFDDTEYQRVFRSMEQDRADAFMISDEPEPITYRATIVEFAAKDRLPAIYPFRDYVEVGGLMAYSIDQAAMFRRIANVIDKILRGANPGDIPFYRPDKRAEYQSQDRESARPRNASAALGGRAEVVIASPDFRG